MIVFAVILRLELVAVIEESLYLVLASRGWVYRRWSDACGEGTVGRRAYRLSSGGIKSLILSEQWKQSRILYIREELFMLTS